MSCDNIINTAFLKTNIINDNFKQNFHKIANKDFWLIFCCVLIITMIAAIVNWNCFEKKIRNSYEAECSKEVKGFKIARKYIFIAIISSMVIVLIAVIYYKKPHSVEVELRAYNINCIGENNFECEEKNNLSNARFELIIKRNVFMQDELMGTAVVDGVNYIAASSTQKRVINKASTYYLVFYKEGGEWMDMDLHLEITDDFAMCQYHAVGDDWFIGPAETEKEAMELYEKFVEIE